MKKNLLFILLFFLCAEYSNAQNAYYDALFCGSLIPTDATSYKDVNLNPGDEEILKQFEAFLKDPFNQDAPDMTRVKIIFQKIRNAQQTNLMASGFGGLELISLVPSLFNLSKLSGAQVDTLLYGVTVYFADEFRKGYMNTYMKTLEKTIVNQKDLQVLFPATYQKILSFDPARYKDFGNEMKRVFDQDLSMMFEHVMDQLETDRIKGCKFLNSESAVKLKAAPAYHYLKMSIFMGQQVINGVHPSEIISELDDQYYSDNTLTNTPRNAIHFVNILQRNLRDTSANNSEKYTNVWISSDKLSKLKNPRALAYFLAFLYKEDADFFDSKITNIANLKTLRITDQAVQNSQVSASYNDLNKNILNKLVPILTKIDELIKTKDKNIAEEQNFEIYLKNINELLKLFADIEQTQNKTTNDIQAIINFTQNSLYAYNSIRTKNYSNIPLYIFNIIQPFIKKEDSTEFINLIHKVDQISGFASAIVSAKTSEEVKDAIKKYADPPASFIDKRENKFHITLGGMPGVFFGLEKLDEPKTTKSVSDNEGYKPSWGLTLPIGVDFTFGMKLFKKQHSFGIFAQALDLGAMLNYRLKTNANSLPDKVGIDAVVSPGIAIHYNFPKSPWTVQFGYQRGPKLRKITTEITDDDRVRSNIFQLRLSYDIPLKKIL